MVIGAEVGHDFKEVAIELRVLSQIFLAADPHDRRPLLFATLVVGIAGHSNLRQVGRMGAKALIYFEVVTTIALFIGWAAITISRAGEGIVLPPPPEGAQIQQTAPPPGRTSSSRSSRRTSPARSSKRRCCRSSSSACSSRSRSR